MPRCATVRGCWPASRAGLFGFPDAGNDIPVTVTFDAANGVEAWRRRFGTQGFLSTQRRGTGRSERLLVETFGPVSVALALVVAEGQLQLVLRRWSIFGLPLPRFLAPRSQAVEFERDGRFHFHVALSHPLTGFVMSYDGWLEPDDATAENKRRPRGTASSLPA